MSPGFPQCETVCRPFHRRGRTSVNHDFLRDAGGHCRRRRCENCNDAQGDTNVFLKRKLNESFSAIKISMTRKVPVTRKFQWQKTYQYKVGVLHAFYNRTACRARKQLVIHKILGFISEDDNRWSDTVKAGPRRRLSSRRVTRHQRPLNHIPIMIDNSNLIHGPFVYRCR